jgi:hypothetical protein
MKSKQTRGIKVFLTKQFTWLLYTIWFWEFQEVYKTQHRALLAKGSSHSLMEQTEYYNWFWIKLLKQFNWESKAFSTRRMNMGQILCTHLCKCKNATCWNYSRNAAGQGGGRRIKESMGGGDSKYDIFDTFCKELL